MVEGASPEQPQPKSLVRLGYRAGQAAQRLWFPLLGHWLGAGFSTWRALVCSALWCMPSKINSSSDRILSPLCVGLASRLLGRLCLPSIIVILATFPTLTWFDIAPPSFLLALGLFILGGLLLGRGDSG